MVSMMSSYNLKKDILNPKPIAKYIFESLEAMNLCTLKFNTLGHGTEDQERFGLLNYVDIWPSKTSSIVVKTIICMREDR